jgi:hypothetical protein
VVGNYRWRVVLVTEVFPTEAPCLPYQRASRFLVHQVHYRMEETSGVAVMVFVAVLSSFGERMICPVVPASAGGGTAGAPNPALGAPAADDREALAPRTEPEPGKGRFQLIAGPVEFCNYVYKGLGRTCGP